MTWQASNLVKLILEMFFNFSRVSNDSLHCDWFWVFFYYCFNSEVITLVALYHALLIDTILSSNLSKQ